MPIFNDFVLLEHSRTNHRTLSRSTIIERPFALHITHKQRMESTSEFQQKIQQSSRTSVNYSSDSADSGLSDYGPNFQTRTKTRLEKYWTRKFIENKDGQTEIVLELPSVSDTETESGSFSPQYQREHDLSDLENIQSYLDDNEKRSQPNENNKEPQRKRKRAIRIGRKQIIRNCPECITHHQTSETQCPRHQTMAQILKATARRQNPGRQRLSHHHQH